MSDYNLTLFEACELLNRSKKSISRYIRRGLLHPQRIKSQQGTLEYRFNKEDLEAFKLMESNKQEYPEFPNSEQALKLYPSLTIISENKELFDSITNSILRKGLSESYLSEGENYYATLGWSIGFLSKIIAIMIKNGWKKQ